VLYFTCDRSFIALLLIIGALRVYITIITTKALRECNLRQAAVINFAESHISRQIHFRLIAEFGEDTFNHGIGVGDVGTGRARPPPPKKIGQNIIRAIINVKFGHFRAKIM